MATRKEKKTRIEKDRSISPQKQASEKGRKIWEVGQLMGLPPTVDEHHILTNLDRRKKSYVN